MRIFYHLSRYISHRQSGLDYIACLRGLGHEVHSSPEAARNSDIAILHDEPPAYTSLFKDMPELRSLRSIAFCVWENERLAEAYKAPLSMVDEIWTPSNFSRNSLLPFFPHTRLLPHIVKRLPVPASVVARMRGLLGEDESVCRFFSIIDTTNPRKNIIGLLQAYALLRKTHGSRVSLVLKQYRKSADLSSLPGVTGIDGELDDEEMAALHILSDAYVSAHHAEGWGLGLSQAMAYGKPLIATGYSGNMDYMDESNSFPVGFSMGPVSEAMVRRLRLFTTDMRWAEVNIEEFAARMRLVADGRAPDDMTARAALICKRFGPENISRILSTLLECPHGKAARQQ